MRRKLRFYDCNSFSRMVITDFAVLNSLVSNSQYHVGSSTVVSIEIFLNSLVNNS